MKKGIVKMMLKFDAKNGSVGQPPKIDSWAPWGAVLADLGERGWLETSKNQADLNRFITPCTRQVCGGLKIAPNGA